MADRYKGVLNFIFAFQHALQVNAIINFLSRIKIAKTSHKQLSTSDMLSIFSKLTDTHYIETYK